MTFTDRVGRSLFVALAVGLGWGIRGDFGHLVGAMYPGAALALGFAYVSGQRSLFLWMPILAGVSGLAIGSGGMMSYGILHGYAKSDTLINYGYGFLTLFLQGSAWGVFGGALVGLVLERRPLQTTEWLAAIGSVLAAGWFTSLVVVTWAGFDINPPRNNGSIAFMGAALGLIAWLIYAKLRDGSARGTFGLHRLWAGNGRRPVVGQCDVHAARYRRHDDQQLERHGNLVRLHRRIRLLLRHGQPGLSRPAGR